jgi:hypothetical protein
MLSPYLATTYYVTNSPSLSQPASGSQTAPFATIQQALDVARSGDTVMIRRGIYRQDGLTLPERGTAEQPITIQGEPGTILDFGADVASWQSSNLTIFTTQLLAPEVKSHWQIVIADRVLTQVNQQADLYAGAFWVSETGAIAVYPHANTVPTLENTVVLNYNPDDSLNPGLKIFRQAHTSAYITLDQLEIRGGGIVAIDFADRRYYPNSQKQSYLDNINQDNEELVIRNCKVYGAQGFGIYLENWAGALIEQNQFYQNGLVNFPRGSGFNWPTIIGSFNGDQITVFNNKIHDNHGEGVGPFIGSEQWLIRGNEVYDNWSVNIYIDTDEGDVVVDSNIIYNTGRYAGQYGTDQQFGGNSGRDYPDGIRIANETADFPGRDGVKPEGDPTPAVTNIHITNNQILGLVGGGIRSFRSNYGDQLGQFHLKDSVISGNLIYATYPRAEAIWIERGDGVEVFDNQTSDPIRLGEGIGRGISSRNNSRL